MGPEGGARSPPVPGPRPLPCPQLGRGGCGQHAEGSPGGAPLLPFLLFLGEISVPVRFRVLNINILLDKPLRGIKTSIALCQERFQCVFSQSVARGTAARLQNDFFPSVKKNMKRTVNF